MGPDRPLPPSYGHPICQRPIQSMAVGVQKDEGVED
jgi:hypothetical protein